MGEKQYEWIATLDDKNKIVGLYVFELEKYLQRSCALFNIDKNNFVTDFKYSYGTGHEFAKTLIEQ